jgi:hypothetical protein
MAQQTLTFVVLPNGASSAGHLGISIYLAPRLQDGATLAQFPDLLHWTSLLRDRGLHFKLSSNGHTAEVPIDRSVLRPAIWRKIFSPKTHIAPFQIPDYDKRLFVSYPARDAMAFVKYAYQTVSTQALRPAVVRRMLPLLLRDLMYRDQRGHSTLDAILSETRIEMWQIQRKQSDLGMEEASRSMRAKILRLKAQAASIPPDGIPTVFSAPAQTRDMANRFALFHHMPSAPGRPPLPDTQADFAKAMDFHKVLTALSSYPSLLRALGLVFDLEIPQDLCPLSPSAPGKDYGTIGVEGAVANFDWALSPQFVFPETSYFREANSFCAAPATPPGHLGSQKFVAGDVINGILALQPEFFHLVEVDVDGAVLKAMTLADNVANAPASDIQAILPSLRSSGIALMANERAQQLLQSIRDNKEFDTALTSNSRLPRPFTARDLVRGYRIDIWSAEANQWYSLHRRNGHYRFGTQHPITLTTVDEEGFTQLAAAQAAEDPTRSPETVGAAQGVPQPGTDIYIHERVARWSGWSLSAPRPGGALNRSPDPALATDPDPTINQPKTPFKMVATFSPVRGSLPKLRFGDRYRLRARAVDLAGNSVLLSHESPTDVVAPAHTELSYLRFEPSGPPALVLRDPLLTGASLQRLVIRTYNSDPSLDRVPSGEVDQRHVAPPKAAVRMVEQHGLLDGPKGHLRGDRLTYRMIVARDRGVFPQSGETPMDGRAQITVPYFPDPIARGAALQNLPNTANDTLGELVDGHLLYSKLTDVQPESGSVTHIDFGSGWPDRKPWRLVLAEGSIRPQWNSVSRVLTVHLPKAQVSQVPLGCYINGDDLSLMGIWDWLRQALEAQEVAAMQNSGACFEVPGTSNAFALLTRLILAGGHPMLTPALPLTLVHAVQQPLGRPEFTLLPVIHHPSQPIATSVLATLSPITSWRSLDSHHAFLLGGLQIHSSSSAKIDIEAHWREFVDSPSTPVPVTKPASSHVDTVDLSTVLAGPISADASGTRDVAVMIPEADMLWFAAPSDTLPGVPSPPDIAAPMHRLPDTKHRRINYTAVASSRFREYFANQNLQFTRNSYPLLVDVPSSSRPSAPQVAYVVPTFGSERQETTNVKTDIRFGNGVRIYLHRPWYSSGEGELLGAVLWPAPPAAPPSTDDREKYKHYITQWGQDPLWRTGDLPEMPSTFHFSSSTVQAKGLSLDEIALAVDVAGHEVAFDAQRKLWYCDIIFENATVYTPFVRLALSRYQPESVPGVELSHVTLADFAQLTPDRSAVLSVSPADPRTARLFVGGVAPQRPSRGLITVTVERHIGQVVSDLAWEAAPAAAVDVTEDSPAPDQPNSILWSGTIHFTKYPPPGRFRVVIREYELLPRDPTPIESASGEVVYGQRIVYAAIIPYDFPTAGI